MAFEHLHSALAQRREQGLLRQRRPIQAQQGGRVRLDGHVYLNFSSNDYLGLAQSETLRAISVAAADTQGPGSSASPLVSGYTDTHRALEEWLCTHLGVPKVLLFSSGFAANHSVIKTLMNEGGTILADRLSHASMLDGARATPARLMRFRHNDAHHLSQLLVKAQGETLVMTEGVFSMDGDRAPLDEIHALTHEKDIPLFLDDAHGFGVWGERGLGSTDRANHQQGEDDILMATFGKAIGTSGAMVACSESVHDILINFARDYIYSTAMSPLLADITHRVLRYLSENSERRERLQANIALFRHLASQAGLPLSPSDTAIQPVVLGDAEQTLLLSAFLERKQILAVAIRPPTVPVDTARIRVTITAAHSDDDIRYLVAALEQGIEQL